MNRFLFRLLGSLLPIAGVGFLAVTAGCNAESSTTDEDLGSADSALTAAQCSYFDVNGKVQICHKTSSAAHPYTILRLSEQGCINGHVAHGGDYVTSTDPASPLYDPTCGGGGCLPVNAPCDATLPCCEGSTCNNGVCVGTPPDPCDGVTCVAIDACHVAGTCDSGTGACSTPAAANGTACNDGNACTTADACSGGTCSGSGTPCQNGGSCGASGGGYTCSCPAGFTGDNCQTPVDLCTTPCPLPAWADDECTVAPCNPATGVCGDLDYFTHLHEFCNGGTGVCSGGVCHELPPTCDEVPCENGGECVSSYCACPAGFAGTHCEIDVSGVDECAEEPCANGGTCIDGLGAYTCSCSGGFTGTWCEIPPAETGCPCSGDPTWEETLSTGAPMQHYQDATWVSGSYVIGNVYRAVDAYVGEYASCSATRADDGMLVASVSHTSLSAAEADACRNIVLAWLATAP